MPDDSTVSLLINLPIIFIMNCLFCKMSKNAITFNHNYPSPKATLIGVFVKPTVQNPNTLPWIPISSKFLHLWSWAQHLLDILAWKLKLIVSLISLSTPDNQLIVAALYEHRLSWTCFFSARIWDPVFVGIPSGQMSLGKRQGRNLSLV